MSKIFIVLFLCILHTSLCQAEIATVTYVQNELNTKVDTAQGAQQTMAGDYVITGTLKVPTQPLPSAE